MLVFTVESHVTAMISIIILRQESDKAKKDDSGTTDLEVELAPVSGLGRLWGAGNGEGLSEREGDGGQKERHEGKRCEHIGKRVNEVRGWGSKLSL